MTYSITVTITPRGNHVVTEGRIPLGKYVITCHADQAVPGMVPAPDAGHTAPSVEYIAPEYEEA